MNIACPTCLEIFTSKCDISTIRCGHVFHSECLKKWLERNNSCPQCRKSCRYSPIIKLYFSENETDSETNNKSIENMKKNVLQLEKDYKISQDLVQNLKENVDRAENREKLLKKQLNKNFEKINLLERKLESREMTIWLWRSIIESTKTK